MSKKLRKRFCPNCAHVLDAVTHIGGEDIKPTKGDITICINSAENLQFNKNIRPDKLTEITLEELPADIFEQITKARQQLIQMIKERNC